MEKVLRRGVAGIGNEAPHPALELKIGRRRIAAEAGYEATGA